MFQFLVVHVKCIGYIVFKIKKNDKYDLKKSYLFDI